MRQGADVVLRESSPYSAAFTREQFLFYEMRITAGLVCEGLNAEAVVSRIAEENLFQYPTERSVRKMAYCCLRRLKALEDETLVEALAVQPSEVAKQICLYAMMKQYRVIWDFMITVVGEKYRSQDMFLGKRDLNVFFMRLQEQDDWVATWSEATLTKLKQVIVRILVENGYLDSVRSEHLNPVLLDLLLENVIRSNNDNVALPAFNCFS